MLEYDRLFIGGDWVPSVDSDVLVVCSPATGDVVGRVPLASAGDVDAAVVAARKAFDDGPWPHLSMAERAEVLERVGKALAPFGPELDQLVPLESGIPVCFLSGSSSFPLFDYYVDLGRTYEVEEVRPGRPGGSGPAIIRHSPVGVVAGVVPWNGPVMQILMKAVPALLAGCSVVVKTAPETPLSSYRIAEAMAAAGIPPGVVSILPGDRQTGVALTRHPGVDRVSFTGSTAAGAMIAADCGRDLRRVNLELGGKSAAILLEDVDLDVGLPTALTFGLFFNGEACSALTRVLIPRSRYDEVVERTEAHVSQLAVGDPLNPDTFIGPLISERQRDIVEKYIGFGHEDGARLVCGGKRPAGLDQGWYVEPTVFADVDNDMRIAREEVFGPLVSLIAYDDVDDAVRLANDSDLGLGGAVFTADEEAGLAVARRLRTGHVGINCQGQDWVFPFGGFKRSGVGREMGVEGFELYTELQTFGLPPGATPAPVG
jgi:acyl-CoA reductase-like NAD-dependent aldehyde dehydrogenase